MILVWLSIYLSDRFQYVNDIEKSTMGNTLSFADDYPNIYLIQTLQIYIEDQTFKSKMYITGSVFTGYL